MHLIILQRLKTSFRAVFSGNASNIQFVNVFVVILAFISLGFMAYFSFFK
jgi:hypothetical protein